MEQSKLSVVNCAVDFYQTQVNLGSDSWVRMSVSKRGFADLTDVTLVDEDPSSIPLIFVPSFRSSCL